MNGIERAAEDPIFSMKSCSQFDAKSKVTGVKDFRRPLILTGVPLMNSDPERQAYSSDPTGGFFCSAGISDARSWEADRRPGATERIESDHHDRSGRRASVAAAANRNEPPNAQQLRDRNDVSPSGDMVKSPAGFSGFSDSSGFVSVLDISFDDEADNSFARSLLWKDRRTSR